MKKTLLPISDLHCRTKQVVEAIKERFTGVTIDFLTISGDLFEYVCEIDQFLKSIDKFKEINPNMKIIFIAGNHDFFDYEKIMIDHPNLKDVHYLYNSVKTIDGIKFYGSPLSVKFGEWNHMLEDDEIEDILLNTMEEQLDVALFHSPPYGFGDLTSRTEEHVGSLSIRNMINIFKPRYAFYGHIHEGDHSEMRLNDVTIGRNVAFEGTRAILKSSFDNMKLITL